LLRTLSAARTEKLLRLGVTSVEEICSAKHDRHGIGILHNDSLQKIEAVGDLTNSLGLLHVNDTETIIPHDTIVRVLEERGEQIGALSLLMNPRDQSRNSSGNKKKKVSAKIRKVNQLINSSPGAMCTLKVHETKRVRDRSGRQTSQSSYRNRYTPKSSLVELVGDNPCMKRVMEDLPEVVYSHFGDKKPEAEEPQKRLLKKWF
jgi:hypothetical protein